VALGPEEVRIAGLAVSVAYGIMAYGFFAPALRRRRDEGLPIRSSAAVPPYVDLLWVSTQGLVLLALFVADFLPSWFALSPASLLGMSALEVAAAGAALAAAGCTLVAWASRTLGAELAVAIEARDGGRLVTNGPYARVRHPIYTGVFMIMGGCALAFAAPLLAAYVPVSIAAAAARARAEERMLSEDPVHGTAYRHYLQRTGRFLPRLRRASA
jgi:protein-S-isoprenylcysteine O-methyltransferase Ste14